MSRLSQDNAMIPWDAAGQMEVLTFDLQGEAFALEASMVQEILDMPAVTAVPGASPFVGGVINFRGKVIPLADLRLSFGMAAEGDTIESRIVVIETEVSGEPTLVGLRTDKVHEVATLNAADSEAPPSVGMSWRPEYIRCLVRRGGEFIVLPDLGAIFSSHGVAATAGGVSSSRT